MEPSPILAVNLHSYSQLWMYPYAYDYNIYPDNVDEIVSIYDPGGYLLIWQPCFTWQHCYN
jgi:hypothetical protein